MNQDVMHMNHQRVVKLGSMGATTAQLRTAKLVLAQKWLALQCKSQTALLTWKTDQTCFENSRIKTNSKQN